jgi:UDP-N-acetylmuramoyl-tripeptide--D-alanyl-D-alanine ligase
MDLTTVYISFFLGITAFSAKRLLRYLRFLQQEEYQAQGFLKWMFASRAFDKRGTVIALLSFSSAYLYEYFYIIPLVQGILLLLLSIYEPDPRMIGKKKLVMTKRAKAIFLTSLLLLFILSLIIMWTHLIRNPFVPVIVVQAPPFLLILSVLLLSPKERMVRNKFRSEAREKFLKIHPYTIGVTGSFGKTSVKNMLGEILSASLGPTFWPQAGVNTEMGITREIRERMNEYDKFSVIEMGAYYIGSIKKLCEFTPVNASIVTAVHLMHLDRFGGEEEVYIAKSELPKSVPPDGILVFNGDNAGTRRMAAELKRENTFLYGLNKEKGHLDAYMYDIAFSKLGTSFSIHWEGKKYQGFTKMHGRGALSNLLASFTMACALGAKPEMVLAVIRDLTPVSNRLEVKLYTNFIQINDAYNSNPEGFIYALEVLRDLPGKRRIMITPGMIELGDKQYAENERIAKEAGQICDLVIVVNEVNRSALMEGLARGGIPEHRRPYFATRDEALAYYETIRRDDDILLLENDLTDVYECEEGF